MPGSCQVPSIPITVSLVKTALSGQKISTSLVRTWDPNEILSISSGPQSLRQQSTLDRQNPPTPSHHSYLSGWGSMRLQSQVVFFVTFWKPNTKETVIVRVLFMWLLYAVHSCGYQICPLVQHCQKLRFRHCLCRSCCTLCMNLGPVFLVSDFPEAQNIILNSLSQTSK